MIVGVGMKTGIVIKRDDPKSVGSDRIVDLVAANEIYGGPAIVIDYGTANTFDVINEKKRIYHRLYHARHFLLRRGFVSEGGTAAENRD